jgi:pyrimidine operon attenuation protein/uracil phosphoribosyltransferase
MGDLAASLEVVLMDASRMSRSIRRIAYSIIEERCEFPLIILGINERGFALAERLNKEIAAIPGYSSECGKIKVSGQGNVQLPLIKTLDEVSIVVVDDVMFSGKTMQQAISFIISHYKPTSLKVASLIDRGHRTLPLEPQYVGLICPTKLSEHVHVFIQPDSDHDAVVLYQHSGI